MYLISCDTEECGSVSWTIAKEFHAENIIDMLMATRAFWSSEEPLPSGVVNEKWLWCWDWFASPLGDPLPHPPHTAGFSSGGVKPEGHGDDHEMVNMEFTCDHCQGLIIGRRMNCNVCDDFDLCYGCYAAKKYSYGYVRYPAATMTFWGICLHLKGVSCFFCGARD